MQPEIQQKYFNFKIFALLALALTIFTFGSLTNHKLDAYDDRDHMIDSAAIASDWSHAFTHNRRVEIRPPIDLIFLLGYLIWGETPEWYHAIQVALHFFTTLILAWAYLELGASKKVAFLAALLFLVQVAHYRALHQITCITFVLGLSLSLLTTICFNKFLKTNHHKWLIASSLLLACGIFSHPTIISIVLFCTYLKWRKTQNLFDVCKNIWVLALTGVTMVSLSYLGSLHGDQVRGLTNSPDILRTLTKPFWYIGRAITSSHWISPELLNNTPTPWEIGCGLLFCLISVMLYRHRRFPATDWAVWSFVTVLPFFNYPPGMMALGPSRHLYIPSAGICFILSWAIWAGSQRLTKRHRPTIRILAFVIPIALGIASLKRLEGHSYYRSGRGYIAEGDFATGEKLISRGIDIAPELLPVDAYERFAITRFTMGLSSNLQLDQALQIYPDKPILKILLEISHLIDSPTFLFLDIQNQFKKALAQIQDQNALALQTARALQNLAGFYHQSHQYNRATALYEQALQIKPDYHVALYNMGNVLNAQGKAKEAIPFYQQAINIQPAYIEPIQNLANTLFEEGKHGEALEIYKQIVQTDSSNSTAHYNLGIAHQALDNLDAARTSFQNSLRLSPKDPEAITKLAEIQYEQNNIPKALALYQQAVALQPNNTISLYNLGVLYLTNHQLLNAVSVLKRAAALAPADPDIQEALDLAQKSQTSP